ncbi:T-complex protein 11 [Pseudomassariella vexata]|uniref:T-complex protein 11 n=1 Tax=Pseudomassariella vexata TaxID=1141098 RepID=A0A1Y2D8Z6_9PEZI|nr:T-complex protein 11 [Pseudomassariella vexata]ORY55115.1 T-complex protein 11 [Pseudomassariella vexata]
MGDQGTGGIEGRMERSARRSISEANPNTHEDQMQKQSNQPETPSPEPEKQTEFHQVNSPRHLFTPPPPASALSRNPSTSSNTSEEWSSRPQRSSAHPRRNELLVDSRGRRPLEPPVTKTTLSELDVNKIIHNPKLRHDINFDPELHFRPNLDGEKGRRKQDKANQFWTTLSEQLQQFVTDPVTFQSQYSGKEWCLPILLRSVKEIIQTLVPARDRAYLDEGLNVDLIMQQFHKGIADLEKLASWLSNVLKSHCAPMRDEWVDEMYNQLTNGNRTNDMEELVQGMRSLLSVLEAMKLDVANHQIRCLRPILIEDTVHFEKRFFWKKIQTGKLDPQSAEHWYVLARHEISPSHASRIAFGEMAIFFEALSRLILPSNSDQFPQTFLFDEERLLKLRTDMLDAVNLEICMRLYERFEREYRFHATPTLSAIGTSFLAMPFSDASGFLTSGSDDEISEFNFNDPPPSRPSSLIFSSAGSAHSSPRSSMILPANPPPRVDTKAKSRELYNSLVALLQTSPPSSRSSQRWKAMKDSLAVQIFRFTDAPAEALLRLEEQLDQHLCEPDSYLFQEVEQHYHTRLVTELQQRARELKPLTGVGLFSVATGGRVHTSSRTSDGPRDRVPERDSHESCSREVREDTGMEDMATRLTHLGLLHWRVWSQLVYQGEQIDTEMTLDNAP